MLTPEQQNNIRKEAEKKFPILKRVVKDMLSLNGMVEIDENYYLRLSYINTATLYQERINEEREKAKVLVKQLQSFIDGYDHDSDAHKYNNLPACRVCSATKTLDTYNKTIGH